jgi:hypothetical protein
MIRIKQKVAESNYDKEILTFHTLETTKYTRRNEAHRTATLILGMYCEVRVKPEHVHASAAMPRD